MISGLVLKYLKGEGLGIAAGYRPGPPASTELPLTPPWCQICADVLGRPLQRVEGSDPGALGAALMTGVGSGAMPDLASAAEQMIRTDREFEPDPVRAALEEDRFRIWQDLIRSTRSVNAALAGAG